MTESAAPISKSITRPRSRRLINAGWCLPPPRSRVHADRHSPMEHSSDRVMSPALSRGHQGRSMPLLSIVMVGNSSFIAAVLIRPSSIRSSRCVPRKSLQGFRRTRSCKFRCRVDLNKKKTKNEKRKTKNEKRKTKRNEGFSVVVKITNKKKTIDIFFLSEDLSLNSIASRISNKNTKKMMPGFQTKTQKM